MAASAAAAGTARLSGQQVFDLAVWAAFHVNGPLAEAQRDRAAATAVRPLRRAMPAGYRLPAGTLGNAPGTAQFGLATSSELDFGL